MPAPQPNDELREVEAILCARWKEAVRDARRWPLSKEYYKGVAQGMLCALRTLHWRRVGPSSVSIRRMYARTQALVAA